MDFRQFFVGNWRVASQLLPFDAVGGCYHHFFMCFLCGEVYVLLSGYVRYVSSVVVFFSIFQREQGSIWEIWDHFFVFLGSPFFSKSKSILAILITFGFEFPVAHLFRWCWCNPFWPGVLIESLKEQSRLGSAPVAGRILEVLLQTGEHRLPTFNYHKVRSNR